MAAAAGTPGSTATASAVHHIGMSVASLDEALAFWERFLGSPARWRTTLDRPYLGRMSAIPGCRSRRPSSTCPAARSSNSSTIMRPGRRPIRTRRQNPGNVHLCLAVDDARAAWEHAVACGARPVVPDGPVEVDGGPNKGARAAYLRIHDGITLELFQRPTAPEGGPS